MDSNNALSHSRCREQWLNNNHCNETVLADVAAKTWRNRRSQKLEKMAILDLQSNLQSEIQAKEAIRGELSNAKTVQVSLEK